MKACSHKKRKGEPDGYIQWQDWAEKMSKRYVQVKCDNCGLFKDWVKKPEAQERKS